MRNRFHVFQLTSYNDVFQFQDYLSEANLEITRIELQALENELSTMNDHDDIDAWKCA